MGRYPTLQDFANHVATQFNVTDIVRWTLYDNVLYPTAGAAQILFFQNPIGQGLSSSPGNVNQPKALSDTNMTLPGALPAPQAFWLETIEVEFLPGSTNLANAFALQVPGTFAAAATAAVQVGEHDVSNILSTGALTLTVSTKPYYQEGPLYRMPSEKRLRLDSSVSIGSTVVGEVVKSKCYADGPVVRLDPGIGIITSQNFNVTINWPAVVATPSGSNGRIGVYLGGWLFRAVQ